MLGHKNFKTTQIYAKVVQEKISNDMKKLQSLLSVDRIFKNNASWQELVKSNDLYWAILITK